MRALPPRPDIEQLRHQAKDLLRAAQRGEPSALERIRAFSSSTTLASAQLALAREHGFGSWPKLNAEVQRRAILDARDPKRLAALLHEEPALARERLDHWRDHPLGPTPLGYVAMQRFDTSSSEWRDAPGAAEMARILISAGAGVNGEPGESETPLITAASYGEAEVARVLIAAGADLEAVASATAGGVPGGTALLHAAVFGMTDVVDVLVSAGARIRSIEEAAAVGDVTGWLTTDTSLDARIRALVMAADHQRLRAIEELVAAGTPVDGVDPRWGRHPLRTAAANGRAESVRRLLELGADPDLTDERGRTPLELCRARRPATGSRDDDVVEALLSRADR